MKIFFLTRFDANDIHLWSGSLYHIYKIIKKKHNVEIIGTEILDQIIFFSKENFLEVITFPSSKYFYKLSRLLTERTNKLNFNLIFFGDFLLTPLEINMPIVLLSDMTFEQNKNYYVKPDKETLECCINFEKLL